MGSRSFMRSVVSVTVKAETCSDSNSSRTSAYDGSASTGLFIKP
jgi:hypothetical protein